MVGALVAGVVAAGAAVVAARWRRRQAGLRAEVRRLTQVADRISDVISVHDGAYVYVSAAALPLLGDVTAREASHGARRAAFHAERARIEGVIEGEALTMAYQPICRLDTREPVAYEALARFTAEPHRSPDLWFAEARGVGLGEELELVAVRKALEAVAGLPDDLQLSINVSPETLLRDELRRMLRRVPLRRLVFEITEHAPIEDYEELLAAINRLSARGIGIAVDDAGAGYSSLRHILNLHPQTIKLDVSLTHDLHRDTSRRALTAALSSFAEELDATVVAEGIETEAELEALRVIGVGFGQGYLLGRPGPIEDRVPVRV
jgi:EAL domain-containing protein (putative c-di-GMP-specific phosphodiesterase class I)